jgi:hypothetical protein
MKTAMILLAIVVFSASSSVCADYAVFGEGAWPKSWPKELEPLRKQSRSIVGGVLELATHEIPFAKREDFESAWPHVLKVKSKGAPVVLLRSPLNHWHFGKLNAGVLIQSPPAQRGNPANPEEPIMSTADLRIRWMWTKYIELVVDGQIVDLNRIPLPADTWIIDLRFTQSPDKSPGPSRRLTLKQLPESLAAARFDPGREMRMAKCGFLGNLSLQADSLRSDQPEQPKARSTSVSSD